MSDILEQKQTSKVWTRSSVGQSVSFTPRRSEVQVLSSPQFANADSKEEVVPLSGISAHFSLMPEGLSASTLLQEMKKVNQKDRRWEPGSHEDPQNPGVYKKVLIRRDEADPHSKLMVFQLCKIPPKTTHVAHSHSTMDEIFYFTEGSGEIEVNGEKEKIVSGDRIIVPAGQIHQIRNTEKVELKFMGLGVALD